MEARYFDVRGSLLSLCSDAAWKNIAKLDMRVLEVGAVLFIDIWTLTAIFNQAGRLQCPFGITSPVFQHRIDLAAFQYIISNFGMMAPMVGSGNFC